MAEKLYYILWLNKIKFENLFNYCVLIYLLNEIWRKKNVLIWWVKNLQHGILFIENTSDFVIVIGHDSFENYSTGLILKI